MHTTEHEKSENQDDSEETENFVDNNDESEDDATAVAGPSLVRNAEEKKIASKNAKRLRKIKKEPKSTEKSASSTTPMRPSEAIRLNLRKGIPASSIDRVFQCLICSAKFHKNCNLIRHMDVHIANRPTNECEICGKTVLDLRVHMRTHSALKPYTCPHCPASFRNSQSMHDHIRRHTDGSKQLICSFCEVVVFSNRDLTRHIAKCTESVPEDALEDDIENEICNRIKVVSTKMRECVLCGTKVKNLKIHLQSHSHERPFACTLCDRTFTQSGHRNLHMRQVHNIEPNSSNEQLPAKEHSCEVCCRNFDSMRDLDDHMRIHISPNGACKICTKVVAPGCITKHLRTHTGNKQYKCTICPTSFHRKDHLEKHMGVHTGIRPYECKVCKETTFTSADLKRHIKEKHPEVIVDDPKQMAKDKTLCSICGKQISTQNIELHMRTHTGARPHKCTICPVSFAQKSNLVNHMRRHTGEKPFHCEPCQKSFYSACALNSHKRRHSSAESFKCDRCDSTFKTKRSLSNHCTVQHNGQRLHRCMIPSCGKTFGWESGLRDHMKQHNIPKYQCKFCDAKFILRTEQREHEQSIHHAP